MENSSSDDDSDTLSEGSDLQLFSEHEFSSDTDSDDDTQQTESSMEPDSQQTEANDDDFWSYDLHPVDIAPFTEQVGPDHTLLPDDDLLKYFYLMINEDFFEPAAQETNRYAEQEMTRKGKCQSIDEGMIRYKGHHYAQQYTPGKTNKARSKDMDEM
uniref:PiggyBac transposable element-derived protein domain-containing protein n=1 Tax=Magallana gigas TaxID=29159 RepID=A0A8W8MIV0_MAGGI